MDDVDGGGGNGAGSGGHHEAAGGDHDELQAAGLHGAESHRQQHGGDGETGGRHHQLALRIGLRHAVGDVAPQHDADAAQHEDQRRHQARLVGRQAVEAVEIARQPDIDRRDGQKLQRAAGVADERRARSQQPAQHAAHAQAPRLGIGQRNGAIVAHQQEQEGQHQAGQTDHAERRLPAPARRDETAQRHAQHRADHGGRQKAADHRGAPRRREHAGEQRAARRAVARLAETDDGPRGEELAVGARQAAGDGGETPHRRHDGDAFDPAPTVGQQRDGKSEHGDGDRHGRGQRPQLLVAQAPFGLERREHRHHDLPVHEVEDHQQERHDEGEPRLPPRHRPVLGARRVSAEALVGGSKVHRGLPMPFSLGRHP